MHEINEKKIGRPPKGSRNLPIKNWIDSNTRNMVVNQIIFEEYIRAVMERRTVWADKAIARLEHYGIAMAESTLKARCLALKRGEKAPVAASSFSGQPFDAKLIARYGKDLVYSKFDLLVDLYIEGKADYVGLPASQVLMAARKYDSVVACERSNDMMSFMFLMKRHFAPERNVSFHLGDIFDFLRKTEKKFSVYDFDLMCTITYGLIDDLAETIIRTSKEVSVVNITTCGGRAITSDEYDEMMPELLFNKLEDNEWRVFSSYSGKYVDSVMPMRAELFVIEKK